MNPTLPSIQFPTITPFNAGQTPSTPAPTPSGPGSPEAASAIQSANMQKYFPNVKPTTTINGGDLGTITPLSTKTPNPDTTARNALSSSVAPSIPSDSKEYTDAITKLTGLQSSPGAAQDTVTQENNAGVSNKLALVNSLESKSMSVAKTYDDQIKAIQDQLQANPTGQFGSSAATAANKQIAELNRQKDSQLADIAIQKSVANADYQGAKDIATKIVAAHTEDRNNQIKAQQDLINNITASPAAKAKMQAALDEISRQGKLEDDMKLKDYEAKIDAQDPLKQSQIQKTQAETKKLLSDAANNPDSTNNIAEQLVRGMIDPSQLSKRTANYNAVLTAADKYSMETTGKHYDISKATRDFKYASNPGTLNTLNYLGSLVGGVGQTGNLDELVNLSNSIGRTQFPALNKAELWTKLETGDPSVAAYHAVVTEVADQVAKVLQGGGTGSATSDSKLNQALSLFQSSFTPQQINAVAQSLKPLLTNRAKNLIGDNPYLSDYADNLGISKSSNTPTVAPEVQSVLDKYGIKM